MPERSRYTPPRTWCRLDRLAAQPILRLAAIGEADPLAAPAIGQGPLQPDPAGRACLLPGRADDRPAGCSPRRAPGKKPGPGRMAGSLSRQRAISSGRGAF